MNEPPAGYSYRNHAAALRMADTIALHQTVLSTDELLAGRFVAVRLADGSSDGVAYDSHAAAVTHQTNSPSRHAYFRIPLERMNPPACDVLLWYVQKCYESGWREDPAWQLWVPTRKEEIDPT